MFNESSNLLAHESTSDPTEHRCDSREPTSCFMTISSLRVKNWTLLTLLLQIKFLMSKKGNCLVEMKDMWSADNVIRFLNGAKCMDGVLQVPHSPYIYEFELSPK